MKTFKLISRFTLFAGSVLLSGTILAHATLSASSPAADAVLNEGPKQLALSFNEGVRLLKVSVTREGSDVETGFTPSAQAVKDFTVMLPALADGVYTVNWTAMGADTHRIEDSFAFTVDADADEVFVPQGAGASPEDHSAHAGHGAGH